MKLVVFSCCEDKSQESYYRLFTSLLSYLCKCKRVSLIPSSILIDFEQDAISAINDVSLQVSAKGCHFQYA